MKCPRCGNTNPNFFSPVKGDYISSFQSGSDAVKCKYCGTEFFPEIVRAEDVNWDENPSKEPILSRTEQLAKRVAEEKARAQAEALRQRLAEAEKKRKEEELIEWNKKNPPVNMYKKPTYIAQDRYSAYNPRTKKMEEWIAKKKKEGTFRESKK